MTDVDLGDLSRAATALRAGRQVLEDLTPPPTSIDAGDLTGVISGFMATFTESATTVSASLAALADGVDASRDDYESTDDTAETGLTSFQDSLR